MRFDYRKEDIPTFHFSLKAEIDLAQGQMTDYRKYSALIFEQGKLVSKTLEKADNGIRVAVPYP